jgi:hypothetical protein
MIVDEFDDGAKLAIIPIGKQIALAIISPEWQMTKGRRFVLTVSVDGRRFTATAEASSATMLWLDDVPDGFVDALYRARKAKLQVGDDSFDMSHLADFREAVDDALRYKGQATPSA